MRDAQTDEWVDVFEESANLIGHLTNPGQRFAGYVAFGISLMLGLQALVSIGVNLGALPTKGLTLPLISSGGSSVLMTCAMAGVLLRATFEINRALDARQTTQRVPAMTVTDGHGAVNHEAVPA